jgi:hypothetical protein
MNSQSKNRPIQILVAAVSLVLMHTGLAQTGSYDWSTAVALGSYPGIKRALVTTSSPRTLRMNCLKIDTTTPGLRFYASPQSGALETTTQTTRQFITQSHTGGMQLVAAINANTWSTFVSGDWNTSKAAEVTGLAMSEGALVSPGHGTPAFLVGKTGVAWIEPNSFAGGEDPDDLQSAVEGAWHLHILLAGNTVAGDTGQHPRTGIGISQDGRYVYFLTVDGRQPSSGGVTTQELGSFLKWFGAWDGINMDGGGSTTMAWWNPSTSASELLNNPRGSGSYSSSNSERHVAVNLGVYYAPDGYDAWVAGFTWGSRSSTPTSDADDDGLTNLAEYALGGNPLGAGLFPPPVSAAQTIFAEAFDGPSDATLNGQVPTQCTTGASSPVWESYPYENLKADGTFWLDGVANGVAQNFLGPLSGWTPQNGYIYDLQATITVNNPATSWGGLCYKPLGNPIWGAFGGGGVGTMLTADEAWPGGAGYVGANGSGAYRIRLDTTGGNNNWKMSYFFNDVQKGNTITWSAGNPVIQGVGLVAYGTGTGSFSNLSLIAYQPEQPASPLPLLGTALNSSALRQATTIVSLPAGNVATHGILAAAWGEAPLQAVNLAQTATVTQVAGGLAFGSQIKNINDGLMVSNAGNLENTTHSTVFTNGSQLKFTLNGTYNIAEIESFTGYQNTRTGQRYSVYTSTNNGSTWSFLASVDHANPAGNNVWDSRRASIRNAAPGAAIATGVNALRFDFSDPSGGSGTAVYNEIAIYPASIAPNSLALTFQRVRTDVDYTVQASDSLLGNWEDVSVNPGTPSANVIYTDPVVPSSRPTRFLRLKMTR